MHPLNWAPENKTFNTLRTAYCKNKKQNLKHFALFWKHTYFVEENKS